MYPKSYDPWVKRLSRLFSIVGILTLLIFNIGLVPAAHAAAHTIMVDTQVDSNDPAYQACTDAPNDCSLRGAISKANADSSTTYTIELPADTYTLTLAGVDDDNAVGDLDIKSSLTLIGSGDESTIIEGSHLDRLFDIKSGATVAISKVKIMGGQAPASGDGGGIYNAGSLTLTDSSIVANTAGQGLYGGGNGGDGGGIYNAGTLTINNGAIMANAAGNGGNGLDGDLGGPGGNGGDGGGIYNSGVTTIFYGSVENNSSGVLGEGGTGWEYENGSPGSSGSGGGIYSIGTLNLAYSTINKNETWGGAGGDCGRYSCTDGTAGGPGGGIYSSGTLTLAHGVVENNVTGNGGPSGGGAPGYVGSGGGIFVSGQAVISDGEISHNITGNGGQGGSGDDGGSGGTGGFGGGIFINSGSEITLTNTSILGNSTGNGGDGGWGYVGIGGSGGNGGAGSGIFIDSASSATMINNIIAGNLNGSGGPGGYGTSGDGSTGFGGIGGIYINTSSAQFLHTTIAQNTGGDGSGIYAAGSTVSLINTILVGQTMGITVDKGSTATLEATLWGSGAWANQSDWGGAGTFNTGLYNYWGDPAFANPTTLDYHIQATSAAIDRGIATNIHYDIDYQPRPNPDTGIPDLGADEYYEYYSPIPIYLPIILNQSAIVDARPLIPAESKFL